MEDTTNRTYEAILRFRSVDSDKEFTFDLEWDTPFGEVIRSVDGDERKLPAAYRAALSVVEKMFAALGPSEMEPIVEASADNVVSMRSDTVN